MPPPARTVRLGERELPRIGLGTNRLTHTPEHVAFISRAAATGIGLIDTAHLYTGGESEATIGEALAAGTGPVVVATKGAYQAGQGRPDVLRTHIEQSLGALRTATIELYYLHRVDPQTPLEDSLGTIRAFVDRGAIRHVGLSQVTVDVIERARAIVPIAAVQNHYSLAERGFDPVVDYCERSGLVFVPFFPLRGVEGPALRRIAGEHEATPKQVALAWLLRRSPAMLPIPGTLSLAHLRENVASLDLELTDAEFAELASAGA
jgi:pyridoxine 4-dehydrogenase